MRILSIPDYRGGNPYQSNLETALQEEVTYGRKGNSFPVARELVWGDVSVVHLHWLSAFFKGEARTETVKRVGMALVWLLLIQLRSIPVVWTVHNVRIHDSEYPRAERLFKHAFINYVCDRFIVHYESVRDEFVVEYDLPPSVQERIDIIPHGHYIDNYTNELSNEEARESLDIPRSSTVFLFFGMVSSYKGIHSLIDAFRSSAVQDSHLVIAGNPERDAFGAALEERCVDDPSIHTDFRYIPDDEIQRYMNAADVVVLPYRDISTSGSALLAMSFGKAIVAPAIGSLPELLDEDGAVIYDPERCNALQSALEAVVERDCEEMGRYNRSVVAEYDWKRIAEQTQETYAKVQ